MHFTKRFYLIFSLIFSLTIPLITITYTTDVYPEPLVVKEPAVTTVVLSDEIPVIEPSINYVSLLLWSLYGTGVLIFGFRFIKNLKNLTSKIKNSERLKEPSHINVLVSDIIVPHTFLKYIFISKKEYHEKSIPEEVLLHEKTHVVQKHTLDILFIEILQVFFWFNPLLIWIKKSMKLNHEFLADQTVLQRQFSLQTYMNLLVNYPSDSNQVALSSPINYSLTKKRIIMMSQKFSKTRAAARLLLLLPILLGCMLLFNNKIVAQQRTVTYKKNIQDTHPDKKIRIKVNGDEIKVNGTSTSLSNFAKTIDDLTKQWKDEELTEFNFSVQMQNAENGLMEKLNRAYRNTRLYKANPDGHDLIPPAPPLPPAPKVHKGEVSDIPPPPAPAPKVRKGQKSNIPPPPAPIKAPAPPSDFRTEEQIKAEVARVAEEAEQVKHEVEMHRREVERMHEAQIASAMEVAEQARQVAEVARENAMVNVEDAREQAEKARAIAMERAHRQREHSHRVREKSMKQAEMARLEAEKVRKMVMQEARMAREQAMLERGKALNEARAAAEEARKQAEKARKEILNEARKARDKVRKEAEEARKEARKKIEKERKKRQRERKKIDREGN
ncbi:M56 family metallopeptidase [Aquimarina gracilis]|uniref:M56 family metallopeptidase n=2 Tax=Aquimarina gracilis TaxID=874422 RepID=A0ABU5ZSS1_9FLAO|nr:M56 family metallopeptidase [Aquimarina gracilis]